MRRRVFVLLACFILLRSSLLPAAAVTSVRVALPPDAGPVVQNIAQVLARQVSQRCAATVATAGEAQFTAELAVQPGLGAEGYAINNGPDGSVRIIGNDDRGLLYGVGKFLHSSSYDENGFTPSDWRGESTPQCGFRAIYAATHYMNFYEAAPAEEVREYVEDLALWGTNTLILHFPTWQFRDFDDPAAKRNLEQIRSVFRAGRAVGLKVGLVQCPNQGFATAPTSIRAEAFPDHLGRRGNHGVNICPSTPEGHDYLTGIYDRLFEEYRDVGLDSLVCWPYDEGGCGCSSCWPWGAKGFPRISRDLASLARQKYPQLETTLSTWCFDTPPAGEWAGLAQTLEHDHAWVDRIMADSHGDFPRYPLDQGVPGGLPLVNFPEISMWGRGPWGGYGANPLPARYEGLWEQTGGCLDGGMTYSEGIYEDINKVICQQFYWNKDCSAEQAIEEYVAFEFSPEVVTEVLEAVGLLEKTWQNLAVGPESLQAEALLLEAEQELSVQARASWRWRILLLRAVIDAELYRNGGKLEGPVLRDAFNELTRIYHAENAMPMVHPPIIADVAEPGTLALTILGLLGLLVYAWRRQG